MATPAGRRETRQINALSPNHPTSPDIRNQWLTARGSNCREGLVAKENPADAATSNGADLLEISPSKDTSRHTSIARAQNYALNLTGIQTWACLRVYF
ncbi:MAG: hypothetical protein RLN85_14825, partial [Pseudomonadales bacterium]